MLGAVIIVVLLLVILPIMVMTSGLIGSAVLGWFLKEDVESRHEGSELIDLNR